MSEKRSWDVTPNKRTSAGTSRPAIKSPAQRGAPKSQPMRDVNPRTSRAPQPNATAIRRPSPRKALIQPAGALRQKRKRRVKVLRYVLLVCVLAIVAGAWYALWLPAFRIQQIAVQGPGNSAVQQITKLNLTGTYAYVIPKNSIFFFPLQKIRRGILDAIPEAAAVSISRTTFSSLQITTTPRTRAFLWCGNDVSTPNPDGVCYQVDSEGLLFKTDDVSANTLASSTQVASTTASTTPASLPYAKGDGTIRIYGALDREVLDGQSPVRAHVLSETSIVNLLKFVGTIRELHVTVSTVRIRDDEADLLVNKRTRITYVIGHEQEAAQLAASSLSLLNLNDGSVEYVDLRFAGKAYVKKYDSVQ